MNAEITKEKTQIIICVRGNAEQVWEKEGRLMKEELEQEKEKKM